MKVITHDTLVVAAKKWLQNRCRLVATEFQCQTASEQPDAIGWASWGKCYVIECKRSLEDYAANKYKGHERSGIGVGDERYFLVPRGMISIDKLYEGWGLLEYRISGHKAGYYIKMLKKAPPNPVRLEGHRFQLERRMLVAIAGRLMEAGIRCGFSFGSERILTTAEE